jgi:uncharacterized membrane protein
MGLKINKGIRNLKLIKYFLIILGFLFVILGILWMIFPIPFGFVLVIVGLIFLSPIPFFRSFLNKIEKKDKTHLLEKFDKKVRKLEGE